MPLGVAGWIGVAGVAANLYTSNKAAGAAKDAASTEANAANTANAQQRADQQPWMDAGSKAVGQLSAETSPGGQFAPGKQFTMADAQNSDAETYAQKQASMASQNSAAARGGLIGTNEQQQLQTNAAGIASQYQNQAFNQWLQTNQQQLNAQQSLAGQGMQSAGNVASLGSGLTVGAGNATAAGQIGAANATTGGVSSLTNQLTSLSSLFSGGSGSGSSAYTSPNSTGAYQNPVQEGGTSSLTDPYLNLGGGGSAGDYSDERLKEDSKRIGYTDDGTPIFTYRMKGSETYKMGVMAQDVERMRPSAVSKDAQGFRLVDYRKLH